MSISYIGQTEFIPVTNPIVHQPEWGICEMTMCWRGAAPELATFLATLTRGMACTETGFTSFKLSDWTQDDDNIYPTVTLSYLNSNVLKFPAYKSEVNWSTQTAQKAAATVGDYTDLRRDVTYWAPTRTYSYYTATETTSPVHTSSGMTDVVYIRSTVEGKDADGADVTFYDNVPAGVATELAMTEGDRVVSHSSTPFGDPACGIWLNEDVVARVLE